MNDYLRALLAHLEQHTEGRTHCDETHAAGEYALIADED